MTERACENCAFPDEELVLVRRVYVTPEASGRGRGIPGRSEPGPERPAEREMGTWDTPAASNTVDEPELWCVSCCSQYPHEVVPDDEQSPD